VNGFIRWCKGCERLPGLCRWHLCVQKNVREGGLSRDRFSREVRYPLGRSISIPVVGIPTVQTVQRTGQKCVRHRQERHKPVIHACVGDTGYIRSKDLSGRRVRSCNYNVSDYCVDGIPCILRVSLSFSFDRFLFTNIHGTIATPFYQYLYDSELGVLPDAIRITCPPQYRTIRSAYC